MEKCGRQILIAGRIFPLTGTVGGKDGAVNRADSQHLEAS